MSKESAYVAARTLLSEGWKAEKITILAVNGSKRQGWKWTDPTGGVCEVIGKWGAGPTKPKKVRLPPTWHMTFKEVSPRNVVFLTKTLPVPCESCKTPFPERSLVAYRGERCCMGCLVERKRAGEREEYRKATFAGRARAFMESQMALGVINAPEACP